MTAYSVLHPIRTWHHHRRVSKRLKSIEQMNFETTNFQGFSITMRMPIAADALNDCPPMFINMAQDGNDASIPITVSLAPAGDPNVDFVDIATPSLRRGIFFGRSDF